MSGDVSSAGRTLTGVKLVLAGSTKRTVVTDEKGFFAFSELDDGNYVLKAEAQGFGFSPPESRLKVAGKGLENVRIEGIDRVAPTVDFSGIAQGQRIARDIEVVAQVKDNGTIAKVNFILDGKEIPSTAVGGAYRLTLKAGELGEGRHTVAASAADAYGNLTQTKKTVFLVVKDRVPPVVKFNMKDNDLISAKKTFRATVTDDVEVSSVEFEVDGKRVGNVLTQAPFDIELDPSKFAKGDHALVIRAKDGAGHATEFKTKFRTRK
jgi:hypothetical protein